MSTALNPIIHVENLAKRYTPAGRFVLDLDALTIQQGEFFGLLGSNGAGKTTLISILCGMIRPTRGQITLFGVNARKFPSRIQQRIGLVTQDIALYEELNAWENLALFGRLYGLRGKHLKQRIEACLELTGLKKDAQRSVLTYSGGMKRLINFAIGIIHEPELLILDEPTLGIDTHARHALLDMISTLNRQQMTIIYTTHYIEDAERLCSRVAIIDEGKILCDGTPQDLLHNNQHAQSLESFFLKLTANPENP